MPPGIVIDENGCWLYRVHVSWSGYGIINKRKAHRVAYEEFYGPIPEGLHVLHKCNTRNCVNPKHLYLGTDSDNMKDRVAAGRNKGMLGMKHTEETKAKMRRNCPSRRKYREKQKSKK